MKEREVFKKDLIYIYNMPNVIFTKGDNGEVIELGKVIRFSGVRDKELETRLSAKGHDCSDGAVTKNTDFLIIPFVGFSSGKVTKALEYNAKNPNHQIQIITLDEFKLNETSYLKS